jgi:hypothetical protein
MACALFNMHTDFGSCRACPFQGVISLRQSNSHAPKWTRGGLAKNSDINAWLLQGGCHA